MKNKLTQLLTNAYSPIDNLAFACAIEMNDGEIFYGVNVKNSVYRDAIYAEQAAIGAAITAGYKAQDFIKMNILVNTQKLTDFRFLRNSIISEFFAPNCFIELMNLKGEVKLIKAGDLNLPFLNI